MATVHAKLTGDKAELRREEFERLLELARRAEPVDVQLANDDQEASLARFAIEGGAFDFWNEAGEDIYSSHDGEGV